MSGVWYLAWRYLLWHRWKAAILVAAVADGEGFFRETERLDPPATPQLIHNNHAGVINEFLESLKEGTVPQTVCTDNIKSLAMVHAAIESAESGRKITIDM